MPRLFRPYIALPTRCDVAAYQLVQAGKWKPEQAHGMLNGPMPKKKLLAFMLELLFGKGARIALDHDPALGLRAFNKRTRKYTPDANDPRYLRYRLEDGDHSVKTRGRGGTTYGSDIHAIYKTRRLERERAGKPKRKRRSRPIRSAGFRQNGPKRRIPSRPSRRQP